MMNYNLIIVALLSLSIPVNTYAITCNSKDLLKQNSINNNKILDQAEKIGIVFTGITYMALVEEICKGDEKLLNLEIIDGTYSEKDVNGYRKILNKKKTTDKLPEPFTKYSDSLKYIDIYKDHANLSDYPATIGYVTECIKKSPYAGIQCSSLIGLVRGDIEFKKIYDKYWMDALKVSNVKFDLYSSTIILNFKNRQYLYMGGMCKYHEW